MNVCVYWYYYNYPRTFLKVPAAQGVLLPVIGKCGLLLSEFFDKTVHHMKQPHQRWHFTCCATSSRPSPVTHIVIYLLFISTLGSIFMEKSLCYPGPFWRFLQLKAMLLPVARNVDSLEWKDPWRDSTSNIKPCQRWLLTQSWMTWLGF